MKTEFVPGKPSPAQADLLAHAVFPAYKELGWRGSMSENASPLMPRWSTKPTRVSLRAKGLLEATGCARGDLRLTRAGVRAGEFAYQVKNGHSAKKGAAVVRREREEIKRKIQDRVDCACHLFRGLSLHRGAGFGKATKSTRRVTAHIKRANGAEIRLNLDDLLELGEQIEKMR